MVLSIALPAILIVVAYVTSYYEFPERIAIGTVAGAAPGGDEAADQLRFIVNVNGPVRFHLAYGLFVGFLSGTMFAVSFLYLRRQAFGRSGTA